MSWPRQGFQKTLEIPKFEFASWISWVWGCACQGRLGGCPPPKRFRHYGERVTMGQFSNSFPKHFSYLCEYAFRFDLSCSFCEYPFILHCLHCSPSCFDPDSLLLAHFWLGLSWIDFISANKRFSSPKTSSRKPYTSSKQQERQKHSVETTINLSFDSGLSVEVVPFGNVFVSL